MQTDNRVLDSMARFFTNAAGAAQSFRAEVETMVKARLENLVAEMDFVTREDFNAVKAMAAKARSENEKLAARVALLEAGLAQARTNAKAQPRSAPKTARPRKGTVKGRGKGKL